MRTIPRRIVVPAAVPVVLAGLATIVSACSDAPSPPPSIPAALPPPQEAVMSPAPPRSPTQLTTAPSARVETTPEGAVAPATPTPPPQPSPPLDQATSPPETASEASGDRPAVAASVALSPTKLLDVYRRPGAVEPRYAFDIANPWHQRVPMLVEQRARDDEGEKWLRVQLPIAPNGTSGWVRGDEVDVHPRRHLLVVDLSRRTISHFVQGELADRFLVGIGRPDAPSARGTFFVWAKVPQADPGGPYGSFVLGLSGMAPISEWTGTGRMAVHGTVDASDRGRRISAGCIRVYNPELDTLRSVPLGTPVVIRG